jgi:hypothetical protein
VGLLNDVAAKQTDQGELIAELEYAAKAKDQALQGFRELAENWKFATTADMADATRQLLATEKSPRRLDPHSGARLGDGVRVNTDHGIEKPSHTFEATSKLIRTPDRSSYQVSSSERRTSQSRGNQEMLSNLFGVSDASKHLAKMSEKVLSLLPHSFSCSRALVPLSLISLSRWCWHRCLSLPIARLIAGALASFGHVSDILPFPI